MTDPPSSSVKVDNLSRLEDKRNLLALFVSSFFSVSAFLSARALGVEALPTRPSFSFSPRPTDYK